MQNHMEAEESCLWRGIAVEGPKSAAAIKITKNRSAGLLLFKISRRLPRTEGWRSEVGILLDGVLLEIMGDDFAEHKGIGRVIAKDGHNHPPNSTKSLT
ncbi:unnamed protein product [Linum tenue]|uniref:Uncharacterized protein n=1 Tax=Linum tenue TaxID=586396 RepID=A0AAV0I9Q6_9ROSI|nr:unnamed protein product [Linum tenue]